MTSSERDVAIKVTLGSLLDPTLRTAFLTEAQHRRGPRSRRTSCRFTTSVQTDSGDFFVISKLIDGSDLSSRIKLDRPDSAACRLRIVEQMAECA
jgi:hypothetical protein